MITALIAAATLALAPGHAAHATAVGVNPPVFAPAARVEDPAARRARARIRQQMRRDALRARPAVRHHAKRAPGVNS